MPRYWVYPTQPHEVPDIYSYMSLTDGAGYMELNVEYKPGLELQANAEKFILLPTDRNQCSSDIDTYSLAMQVCIIIRNYFCTY